MSAVAGNDHRGATTTGCAQAIQGRTFTQEGEKKEEKLTRLT